MNRVENFSKSVEVKKQQLELLDSAVSIAGQLFQNARAEYMDVLFSQRDRNEARLNLIEAKKEQLAAIVNTYQALGGGMRRYEFPVGALIQPVEDEAKDPKGEDLPPPKPPEDKANLPAEDKANVPAK